MLYKKKTNPKGFTLIELLFVIAIIGILASAILASLSTARQKARSARKKSELSQIMNVVQAYYTHEGSAPINPNPGSLCNIGTGACLQELITRGYLNSFPLSPDSNPYRYYDYGTYFIVSTRMTPEEYGPGTLGYHCSTGGSPMYYCFNFRK